MILHATVDNEFVRFSGSVSEHCHLPNPAETEIRAKAELVPLQQIAEDEAWHKLLSGEALAVFTEHNELR